ncbi:MAG: hypothetical protein GX348_03905 [Veillonellaceae bacterium]|nr:hypothetical protein [Veillonellaceae bacterium]
MTWLLLFILSTFLFGAAFFTAARTGILGLWLLTAALGFFAAVSYVKLRYPNAQQHNNEK